MYNLLDLPSEIVDLIIEVILLHARTPPATVKDARSDRLALASKPETRSWPSGPQNVVYGRMAVMSNAASLLRVNRRFNVQTRQSIARLFPEGATYKLDVMLVNEQQLWPTWLHVSHLSERVKSVDVTFRIFGMNKKARSAFIHGNGGPPPIVWSYYFLLEHFLEYGPYPSTSDGSLEAKRRHRIAVESVNMHFQAGNASCIPADSSNEMRMIWQSFQSRRRNRDVDRTRRRAIHPEWFAQSILAETRFLLGMSYHASQWGMLLHQRVGRFRVLPAPGAAFPAANIAVHEVLARLKAQPDNVTTGQSGYTTSTMGHLWGECRILSFWNWKWKTVQGRRELGLEVADDIEWPSLEEWLQWKTMAGAGQARYRAQNYNVDCSPARCLCLEAGLEDWLRNRLSVA